jgi:hypothetical protein
MNFRILQITILILFLLFTEISIGYEGFVDNGNNTISDTKRKLMWQKLSVGQFTWQGAIDYCNGLVLAGFSDWRLPHVKELMSIVDYNKVNPAIDTTFFPNGNDSWSSTNSAGYTSQAWRVILNDGRLYYFETTDPYGDAQCVRSGE